MPYLKPLVSVLVAAALGVSAPARAQYEPASIEARYARMEAQAEKVKEALIGTTFWLHPRPGKYPRIQFFDTRPQNDIAVGGFHVTEPTSFEVIGYEKGSFHRWVRIRFKDGKEAYMLENAHFRFQDNPEKKHLLDRVEDVLDVSGDEHLSTVSPEELQAREDKAKAEAAAELAALKARGPARIGMSRKQVLASSWGRPTRVNTTTRADGVSEQWVYGDSHYLYFHNGKLISIQH